jgi:cation diffusion facilitator CzcD-associated flavoprotein CzcO
VDAFTGEVLHSSDYRNPRPFQGKTVLLVGSGLSGMEIAHDLATGGAAKVWLAIRTPPNIMLRSLPGGLSVDLLAVTMYRLPPPVADAIGRRARHASLGDLSEFGLPIPEEGVFTRGKRVEQAPTLVDMDVIDAIKPGSIEVVAALDSFDRDKVVLVDGSRLHADTVFWPPVTGVVWNRSWATSACWTPGVSPSLRGCGPPRTGCGSSATTSGHR